MSDLYQKELKRQETLQKQLEEKMERQETQKQRDEQVKTQMEWLNKQ